MAHTKAELKKAAIFGAQLGPDLLDLAKEFRAGEAARAAQARERQARELAQQRIESALKAEAQAFEDAGLLNFDSIDAQAYTPVIYQRQPVTLINTNAHPSALLATALARAERVQAFARVLEQSDVLGEDRDAKDGAYTLARMAEEVVEVMVLLAEHRGIRDVPLSTMQAT